jgi:hypothetical protein
MAALARASAGTHGGHIAPGHHRSPRSDDVRHRLACHCNDERLAEEESVQARTPTICRNGAMEGIPSFCS